MNSTLSLLAYIISSIALCISIINYFRISTLKEHMGRTHLLINDVLITVKALINANEEFVKDMTLKMKEEKKNDGHTVRSDRATKKTRRTSDN